MESTKKVKYNIKNESAEPEYRMIVKKYADGESIKLKYHKYGKVFPKIRGTVAVGLVDDGDGVTIQFVKAPCPLNDTELVELDYNQVHQLYLILDEYMKDIVYTKTVVSSTVTRCGDETNAVSL